MASAGAVGAVGAVGARDGSVLCELRWQGRLVEAARRLPGERFTAGGHDVVVMADGVTVDGDFHGIDRGVAVGPLQLLLSTPTRNIAVSALEVDVAWWRTVATAVICMGGVLFGALLTPVLPNLGDDALIQGRTTVQRVALSQPPKPPPPPPKAKPARASSMTAAASMPAAASAPKQTMQRRRDADRAQAMEALQELGLTGAASTQVFAAATDIERALVGLQGPGHAGGDSGLGTRSLGGGLVATSIGIGVLGSGTGLGIRGGKDPAPLIAGEHRPAQVKGGTTTTVGALDRGEVQRVLSRAMSRFRFCYERQLTTTPTLEGKLATFFTIGGTGDVVQASVVEGMDDSVDRCVLQVLRSLRFPAPKGGGVVTVTYPFVFSTT